MTVAGAFRRLTRWMAVEEWRLHSTLFGGRRFAGFPAFLFVLAAVASFALAQVGVELPLVAAGVVVLAGVVGLQTGSVGFEVNDALENLLGDVTLLVYASRTLPVSGRTAFAAFVVKDLAYYLGLFILPTTLGVVAGAKTNAVLFPGGGFRVCLTCGGPALGAGHLGVVAAATAGLSAVAFFGGLAVSLGLSGVSLAARSLGRARSDARTTTDRYAWLAARFGGSPTAALAAKTVLDVHRSSGGLWKLGLSSATLLGASYVVVELVAVHVPIAPSYGVLFGALASVTAFPTYTWVTRVDGPGDYRFYPVRSDALVRAKAWAFAVLETPVVLVYAAVAVVALSPTPVDVAVGTVVLAGLLSLVFGATVALTGFDPSASLFDTVVFAKYSLVVGAGLLFPLVVGLFVPVEGLVAGVLVVYGVGCLVAGGVLFGRAEAGGETALRPTAR